MIERLFPEDFPFGEPEYSKLTEEIRQLCHSIAQKLNDEGIAELEQLSEYIPAPEQRRGQKRLYRGLSRRYEIDTRNTRAGAVMTTPAVPLLG